MRAAGNALPSCAAYFIVQGDRPDQCKASPVLATFGVVTKPVLADPGKSLTMRLAWVSASLRRMLALRSAAAASSSMRCSRFSAQPRPL